ncbi:hypothetical protein EGK_04296 [Macaca mulatta]|uniref:Uncharacterized protein n=1 Tax=Macaca mulatta TaxID=9544 RepID=F7GHN2_MACMU|nr:hypothetical protein EGK_04296 [Macaca mulatta]
MTALFPGLAPETEQPDIHTPRRQLEVPLGNQNHPQRRPPDTDI